MSNNPPTGSGTAYRENLRKHYDDLMKEAEDENRNRLCWIEDMLDSVVKKISESLT